jgi:hypothetical protein
MSKYGKGILGPFSGLVGTVVGATFRGEDVMRSKPKKSSKVPGQGQLDQRMIFALIIGFLKPLAVLIRYAFKSKKKTLSEMNAAVQYNLINAVSGTSPLFTVNYPMVRLSNGILPGLADPKIVAVASGRVTITWNAINDESIDPDELATRNTDTLRMVTYCPATKMYYTAGYNILRSAGTFNAKLPNADEGDLVHVWAIFISADNRNSSTSQYLGAITTLE